MNFKTIAVIATLGAAQPLAAGAIAFEPGVFGGVVWNFGAGAGISLKAYASNQPGAANVTGGVTYYFDGSWGADIGVVYYDCGTGGLGLSLGYDFLQSGVQAGLGFLSNGLICPP